MKTLKKAGIVFVILAAVFIAACEKEGRDAKPSGSTVVPANTKYAVDVVNGRLHFKTFNEFDRITTMKPKEFKKFTDYVQALPEFKSLAKKKPNLMSTNSSCNCTVNDEYVNGIVDENYMVDIEQFTVKIDACISQFYVLDLVGIDASVMAEKQSALASCDYAPDHHFYEVSFDDELLYALEVMRDAITNGEPVISTAWRCGDVACSDRIDHVDGVSITVQVEDPPASPTAPTTWHNETIAIPKLWLEYTKGIINGRTKVYMKWSNLNPWPWYIYVDETQYREKCGDLHDSNSGLKGQNDVSSVNYDGGIYYCFDEYYNKRLKAGFGNVRARIQHAYYGNYGYYNAASDWAEIVF